MAQAIDWRSLSNPSPEWEAFVKTLPNPSIISSDGIDLALLRAGLAQAAASKPPPPEDVVAAVQEYDENVPTRDGDTIGCRIYKSRRDPNDDKKVPVGALVILIHGGGWCVGDVELEADVARQTVMAHPGTVCVSINYRLAPEFKFPIPLEDCHDAVKWAVQNASKLGADPAEGFIFEGSSSGANLAASLQNLWAGSVPVVTGLFLAVPWVTIWKTLPKEYEGEYEAWEQNRDAALLSQGTAKRLAEWYAREPEDWADPRLAPILAAPFSAEKHPPTFFQVCGADPLRDDSRIYERVLRKAGIKSKIDVYPGLPHGFWATAPHLESSQKWARDSAEGMRWLLQGE